MQKLTNFAAVSGLLPFETTIYIRWATQTYKAVESS